MSSQQIRHGILIPASLRREHIFIKHLPGKNDIAGVFMGKKDDTPVCIVPKTVIHTAADVSAPADCRYVGGDTTGGAITITLPETQYINDGATITIKDEGGNAGTANITIATPGAETSDIGVINVNGDIVTLLWDLENQNWIQI